MNNTAILLGTSNQKGNTAELVSNISKIENIKVYDLKNYNISPFDYEHKNIDDDFIGLVQHLLKYDMIIFASPVYWYAMSAQMKIFFDRLSDLLHIKKELGRQLRGKSTAILSTGASAEPERSFEEVFINSFEYLNLNYKGLLYCYCKDDFNWIEHKNDIENKLDKILND
jgi:multimeric flavodoxin WrbA